MAGESLAVFVINLDSAKARLEKITGELHAKGIAFERVAAVDGRRLPDAATVVSPLSRLLWPRPFLPQEIGCWLSHRKVWERIVAERIPLALVLEDDASPHVSYDELASIDLSRIPLDLLRVHILISNKPILNKKIVRSGTIIAGRELVFQTNPRYSATAYLVTLAGAQKLMSRRKMLGPVDWFSLWGSLDGLRHGILLPNMFEADDDGRSTIGDRTLAGWERRYRRLVKRNLLRPLDRRHARRQIRELENPVIVE